jgi:hypothetical protein
LHAEKTPTQSDNTRITNINFLISFPPKNEYKIKSAATEATAPKNANSDCRQTNFKQLHGYFTVQTHL